eukprot:TRINITY_DN7803_c0_g1_i3.p1 TRINITY_DN7803_c0_g1~~TRINITY_DN7803_c0_g1_i3.p1  ORF type:complete len:923 (-),score=232.41 TRINITY_DN7803_c0_g1_i3:31-2799(-)
MKKNKKLSHFFGFGGKKDHADTHIDKPVFGAPLEEILARFPTANEDGEASNVPFILQHLVGLLEDQGGALTEGLFRIPGSANLVQNVKKLYDEGKILDKQTLLEYCPDVHALGGVLKLYIRDLPDPAIPFQYYEQFVEAHSAPDYTQRMQGLYVLLHELPPAHYALVKYVMAFLQKVIQNSSVNKMTPGNLAIVFGPTMMRPEKEDVGKFMGDSQHVNGAMLMCMDQYAYLFDEPQPDTQYDHDESNHDGEYVEQEYVDQEPSAEGYPDGAYDAQYDEDMAGEPEHQQQHEKTLAPPPATLAHSPPDIQVSRTIDASTIRPSSPESPRPKGPIPHLLESHPRSPLAGSPLPPVSPKVSSLQDDSADIVHHLIHFTTAMLFNPDIIINDMLEIVNPTASFGLEALPDTAHAALSVSLDTAMSPQVPPGMSPRSRNYSALSSTLGALNLSGDGGSPGKEFPHTRSPPVTKFPAKNIMAGSTGPRRRSSLDEDIITRILSTSPVSTSPPSHTMVGKQTPPSPPSPTHPNPLAEVQPRRRSSTDDSPSTRTTPNLSLMHSHPPTSSPLASPHLNLSSVPSHSSNIPSLPKLPSPSSSPRGPTSIPSSASTLAAAFAGASGPNPYTSPSQGSPRAGTTLPLIRSASEEELQISENNPLETIQNRLERWRREAGRPYAVDSMTLAQLKEEKSIVKKELRDFDIAFRRRTGQLPKKQDKEVMRPLYQRYRDIKLRLEQTDRTPASPSTPTDTHTETTTEPIRPGMQSPEKRLIRRNSNGSSAVPNPPVTISSPTPTPVDKPAPTIKSASPTQKRVASSSSSPTPSAQGPMGDGVGTGLTSAQAAEIMANMPPDQQATYRSLRAEKKQIQIALHQYQNDFVSRTGRRVQYIEDRLPVKLEYDRYKELKVLLAKMEATYGGPAYSPVAQPR